MSKKKKNGSTNVVKATNNMVMLIRTMVNIPPGTIVGCRLSGSGNPIIQTKTGNIILAKQMTAADKEKIIVDFSVYLQLRNILVKYMRTLTNNEPFPEELRCTTIDLIERAKEAAAEREERKKEKELRRRNVNSAITRIKAAIRTLMDEKYHYLRFDLTQTSTPTSIKIGIHGGVMYGRDFVTKGKNRNITFPYASDQRMPQSEVDEVAKTLYQYFLTFDDMDKAEQEGYLLASKERYTADVLKELDTIFCQRIKWDLSMSGDMVLSYKFKQVVGYQIKPLKLPQVKASEYRKIITGSDGTKRVEWLLTPKETALKIAETLNNYRIPVYPGKASKKKLDIAMKSTALPVLNKISGGLISKANYDKDIGRVVFLATGVNPDDLMTLGCDIIVYPEQRFIFHSQNDLLLFSVKDDVVTTTHSPYMQQLLNESGKESYKKAVMYVKELFSEAGFTTSQWFISSTEDGKDKKALNNGLIHGITPVEILVFGEKVSTMIRVPDYRDSLTVWRKEIRKGKKEVEKFIKQKQEDGVKRIYEKYGEEVFRDQLAMDILRNIEANPVITANAVVQLMRGTKVSLNADIVYSDGAGMYSAFSEDEIQCYINRLILNGMINRIHCENEYRVYYRLKISKTFPVSYGEGSDIHRLMLKDEASDAYKIENIRKLAVKSGHLTIRQYLSILDDCKRKQVLCRANEDVVCLLTDAPDPIIEYLQMVVKDSDEKTLKKTLTKVLKMRECAKTAEKNSEKH